MLGYDRRDRSNVNDPELVDAVARYLLRHGVNDVAVLEAPTVYGNAYRNRSVSAVAVVFRFRVPGIPRRRHQPGPSAVHLSSEASSSRPSAATWLDADLRIVMPKLRTDPTEFAHLSLSTLEGSTGADRRHLLRRAGRSTSARPP